MNMIATCFVLGVLVFLDRWGLALQFIGKLTVEVKIQAATELLPPCLSVLVCDMMLIYLPHLSSLAETPEAEKMDTDTDSQQADKVKPTFKYHLLHVGETLVTV